MPYFKGDQQYADDYEPETVLSYLCRTQRHQMCGDPHCDCECHYAMTERERD